MGDPLSDETIGAIVGECLAVRVRALNRAITALYDDAFRPLGVRVGQLNLMVVIARMGTARAGDLCRVLCMDKSTLSRDVEVLRRHGWLEDVDADSGRSRPIRLSESGRELLASSVPAWKAAQEEATSLLGEEGAATILRVGDALWSRG